MGCKVVLRLESSGHAFTRMHVCTYELLQGRYNFYLIFHFAQQQGRFRVGVVCVCHTIVEISQFLALGTTWLPVFSGRISEIRAHIVCTFT